MHAAHRALLAAIASLLTTASCSSSDSSGSGGAGGGGGSGGTAAGGDSSAATTGTGGSTGNDNECKFSNCPNETNPLTDDACNLLINGPCGTQARASFKCVHDNDRCLPNGRQDGTYVREMCLTLQEAVGICINGDGG
jgi:hypothetical protein